MVECRCCFLHTVQAAAAKTALSTIETHESSSIADAPLLSLTLGDEIWEVLWVCDEDTAAH